MIFNTNTWNTIRYTIHSVYYDLILLLLDKERQRAIKLLSTSPGSSILIVGAGTGLDLPYLCGEYFITATDITPMMVKKLERRAKKLGLSLDAKVMDGQHLQFADGTFDYVILNLILAVIPDPVLCLQESARVLKPGGEILVFDKFLQEGRQASVLRRIVNTFAKVFFTDINRRFSDILSHADGLQVVRSSPSILDGMFIIHCLRKEI